MLSGVIPRLVRLIRWPEGTGFTNPLGWFYNHICKAIDLGQEENASVIYGVVLIIGYWLVGLYLDKRKIYIRV